MMQLINDDTYLFFLACIVQGPELQIVKPGDNATFQCITKSHEARWVINGDFLYAHSYYDRPYSDFVLTRTIEGGYANLTAVVQTSSSNSRGEIYCGCMPIGGSFNDPDEVSDTAQWLTSCLGEIVWRAWCFLQ